MTGPPHYIVYLGSNFWRYQLHDRKLPSGSRS